MCFVCLVAASFDLLWLRFIVVVADVCVLFEFWLYCSWLLCLVVVFSWMITLGVECLMVFVILLFDMWFLLIVWFYLLVSTCGCVLAWFTCLLIDFVLIGVFCLIVLLCSFIILCVALIDDLLIVVLLILLLLLDLFVSLFSCYLFWLVLLICCLL